MLGLVVVALVAAVEVAPVAVAAVVPAVAVELVAVAALEVAPVAWPEFAFVAVFARVLAAKWWAEQSLVVNRESDVIAALWAVGELS